MHPSLEISLKRVVCTFDTFGNNFVIHHKLERYFMESCLLASDQHILLKYFFNIDFAGEKTMTLSGNFGRHGHEWTKGFKPYHLLRSLLPLSVESSSVNLWSRSCRFLQLLS